MGTTESNVDHAASGQTVAGDSGELTFTYAQGRFASEGKDWESPVVTNMAASVSADAGNAPAGSITNTGTNNTFTSTTESSLATLLSNQCPFVIKATIFEGNGKNAIRERLGEKAHFVSAQHMGLRAGSACALAAKRLEAGEEPLSYLTLLPLYLRAPQAERERAAREAAKHE